MHLQTPASPIAELANQISNGIPLASFTERVVKEHPTLGKLTFHPWSKKLHPEIALLAIAKFFTAAYDADLYDPLKDQIIMPLRNGCGTDGLNKHIANHLAQKAGRDVYEITAGINKHYFSVGDFVRFDNEEAEIVQIERNGSYLGKCPQKNSPTLDYWGYDPSGVSENNLDEIDEFLADAVAATSGDEEGAASHVITLRMINLREEIHLEKRSEINSLTLSYAITVKMSQGLEWDSVFLIFHQSHNAMLKRAFLHTAITRARKQLYVICEPDTFDQGIRNHDL